MKNRHNFEFSPKTMLVLLTILCILLLSVSTVLKDVVKPLSTVAETVVIPMQDGINSFGVWVGEHVGSFKSMKELKKENAKLNQKVKELTQENETLSTNENELNSLQKLLKSKGSGNWYNTFIINKGTKDGIKVNMNVLADGGLVGIITETGRTYAKVCSIINDTSSVSAKSSQTGDTCVVQGNSESVQKDGTIDVTYISKDADMKEGEELITSHISSKYLEGIKIGTVSSISTDSSNLTQSAKVTPFVDFQHLEDVLVITQLKEVPADSERAD